MAKWRVRKPFSYFHNEMGYLYPYTFTADEKDPEVISQRHKLDKLEEYETPEVAEDVIDPRPLDIPERRRGRPRKLNRAIVSPPNTVDVGQMPGAE